MLRRRGKTGKTIGKSLDNFSEWFPGTKKTFRG
jgi:hypothetical protein